MKTKLLLHRTTAFGLACFAMTIGNAARGDESNPQAESKTQSSTAQVEVRVERRSNDGKPEEQQHVSVAVEGKGDVKGAIEKLEKQLKSSGIPEGLQQQALKALRSKIDQQTAGGNSFSGKATWSSDSNASTSKSGERASTEKTEQDSKANDKREQSERKAQSEKRFEVRLPFDRLNQNFPSATIKGFTAMQGLNPAIKKKLRSTISETLKQNGVSSEVIDKTLSSLEKTLEELGSHSGFSWRGSEKLPYRVGIGCKPKEANDDRPGLEVETVFEDSPASKVGIKAGDRLVSIDGQVIRTHEDIVSAVQKAGEENRSVRIEATREDIATVYELTPNQTAVADLNIEMFPPGAMMMQHWGMPPMQFPGAQAYVFAQGSTGGKNDNATRENQNEKNIDELTKELSGVHKELEEIKDLIKKRGKNR